MEDFSAPLDLSFKKAIAKGAEPKPITSFSSYAFDRSILTPASAFRFTAEGVDKAAKLSVRSGDTVFIHATNPSGTRELLGTGIIDETDSHITANSNEYVLTGRDMLGQLVDNSAVDLSNQIINLNNCSIKTITSIMLKDTRLPQQFLLSQVPNLSLLFQTNAGETKISALQRYLEFMNCLIWTRPNGQVVVGKPDFTQKSLGVLQMLESEPANNNILEARVKRNVNQAIRRIVTQLSSLRQVNAGEYTLLNSDPDMRGVASGLVGRSVYRNFSYGQGEEASNQIVAVGNQNAMPRSIGNEYSAREIARENMKILDIEVVVEGHYGPGGTMFNMDQVWTIQIEDEDVSEDMYCYSISYELTLQHGLMTKMRFCRLWSICAYADQLRKVAR